MLATRLWMGSVLVLLTAGMLVFDQRLAPWFPFLFVFVLGLALAACYELIGLLGSGRCPQPWLCYLGVTLLVAGNWVTRLIEPDAQPWTVLLGLYAGLQVAVFLWAMATFTPASELSQEGSVGQAASRPNHGNSPQEGRLATCPTTENNGAVEHMARTLLLIGYLGLLPCFLVQLRWLYPAQHPEQGSAALALAIFVPKCCDIGAYCTGRLLGRHRMTPVLSPKKTWEGAAGGLVCACVTAAAIDRLGPVPLLKESLGLEIAFGISVGIAGMLGDLAESLIKRDCRRKDASRGVPGFGGILDVVDAVIFAAPVAYLWLRFLR